MNPIEKLFFAITNKTTESVKYGIHQIHLTSTWMPSYDLYHIVVDGRVIHSAQRSSIRKIIKEWMEGNRKLEDCGDDLFLLIKC
jgi:hypothetical protein